MSREADIERVGNILAGSLAVYWLSRGLMIFSAHHRDVCFGVLQGFGDYGRMLADVWPAVSTVFMACGAMMIWRPADRRVHVLQGIVLLLLMGVFFSLDTSLVNAGFGPWTKEAAPLILLAALGALSRPTVDLYFTARRLHLGLALICLVHGWINLMTPPAAEVLLLESVFPQVRAELVVTLSGGLQAFAGLVLMMSTWHGVVTVTVLLAQIVQWTVVPGLVVFARSDLMHNPLVPLIGNLPLIGAAATLWLLGRREEVRFFGTLKGAERIEGAACVIARLQSLRFGAPFSEIAAADHSQYRSTRLLLESRHVGSYIEDRLLLGLAWLAGSLIVIFPPALARRVVRFTESWAMNAYLHCLDLLPDVSLSRRWIEDIVAAKKKHVAWLRDAA